MKKFLYIIVAAIVLPLSLNAGHLWVITYAKGVEYKDQGYLLSDNWPEIAYEI